MVIEEIATLRQAAEVPDNSDNVTLLQRRANDPRVRTYHPIMDHWKILMPFIVSNAQVDVAMLRRPNP